LVMEELVRMEACEGDEDLDEDVDAGLEEV
jgi:hypothetical protein